MNGEPARAGDMDHLTTQLPARESQGLLLTMKQHPLISMVVVLKSNLHSDREKPYHTLL